ncbi:MAG: glycosyltransferase family 4 protein [Acidobacteria bacterium]|nr:glycosyltransferase family 4 protein [Acidobacteriota bacterium]
MSRVFAICPEPVRNVTAGVGTRMTSLAGVLAGAGHPVTLAVPNDPQEAVGVSDGVSVIRAEPERLGRQADGHDLVLLHGHLGNHYLEQRDDLPVVVDLYDPFLIDNLHYYPELGLEPFATDHATWRLQMACGDLFLCSSAEQRGYYLGWLTALGRVSPPVVAGDPGLERLIVEVPFGVPSGEPPPIPARAAVLPDRAGSAELLYFGGIYDWYDPLVVLEALPAVLERHPAACVVFVDHPHPELTPQSVAARTRAEATRRGWLGSHVVFTSWRSPADRFSLPQVCDLAVVTHRPGLETMLSLRTRLVDLLWLGLPLVVSEGGTMSRVVRETGAGEVVPPHDPAALATAINAVLGDGGRRAQAGEAGRRWAADRTWERVARPLLEFAAQPWRDRHRGASGVELGPPAIVEPLSVRLRRWARRAWRRP